MCHDNLTYIYIYIYIYTLFYCIVYIYIYIYHHHHHIALVARISLTLSRHSSLSFIALIDDVGWLNIQHQVHLERSL